MYKQQNQVRIYIASSVTLKIGSASSVNGPTMQRSSPHAKLYLENIRSNNNT
jgi:hypothetical protein